MELYNQNLLILGFLIGLMIVLSNLIYLLWFKIFKIKAEEFTIFYDINFKIKRTVINETIYILGWLPLGGYVKPLNINSNQKQIDFDEKLLFVNKSNFEKFIIYFTPTITFFIFGIIIPLIVINIKSIQFGLEGLSIYIQEFFHSIFSNDDAKNEFNKISGLLLKEISPALFTFIIFSTIMLIFSLIGNFREFLNSKSSSNKFLKRLSDFLLIIFLILILWKIPAIILSNFNFLTLLIYFINMTIGIYVAGIFFYFLITFCAKIAN